MIWNISISLPTKIYYNPYLGTPYKYSKGYYLKTIIWCIWKNTQWPFAIYISAITIQDGFMSIQKTKWISLEYKYV